MTIGAKAELADRYAAKIRAVQRKYPRSQMVPFVQQWMKDYEAIELAEDWPERYGPKC